MSVTVSEETVKKVKDSWDIVLQIDNCVQVAGELLFRNIFKTAPGAHKMFPFGKEFEEVDDRMFKTRMFKKHAKLVVGMLDNAVQSLGPNVDDLEEILVDLGAKHVGYGILPEHYPIVGQALLETLATALGEHFSDDLKSSWAGVYGFITTSMLKGANESLLRLSVPVYSTKRSAKKKQQEEITLDEYVSSMLPGQTELYYITMSADGGFTGMDRLQHAKTLQSAGVVILHIHKNKQSLLAKNLQKYLGRKMVDLATDEVDAAFLKQIKKGHRPPTSIQVYKAEGLNDDEAKDFCKWFQAALGQEQVEICTPTCNFASQAARVIHAKYDTNQERHLEDFRHTQSAKKHVEINPSHPLVIEIHRARNSQPFIANMLAAQIYDNCLTQAGMLQDFRVMVNRINDLSMMLLQEKSKNNAPSDNPHGAEEESEEEKAVEEKPESSTEEEEEEQPEDDASVSSGGSASSGGTGAWGSHDDIDDSYDGAGSYDSAAFNDAESYGLAALGDDDSDGFDD